MYASLIASQLSLVILLQEFRWSHQSRLNVPISILGFNWSYQININCGKRSTDEGHLALATEPFAAFL